jgi:hypothetical protein
VDGRSIPSYDADRQLSVDSDTTRIVPARRGLPRPISLDALRDAVGAETSWRGVMRRLGFTTSRTGQVLRELCDEFGIDYSHFRHGRVDLRPVADVVRTSTTWEEVLERLGYAPSSGSARATIRRACIRAEVDVAHLRLATTVAHAPWPTPDLERLRDAGPYLVAAYLTLCGHRVSWPSEGSPYDLLADMAEAGIARIQVKTGITRGRRGWTCGLTRSAYTRDGYGGHRRAHYSSEEIDYFACVDGDRSVYLIPIAVCEGMTTISLSRYDAYRVAFGLI